MTLPYHAAKWRTPFKLRKRPPRIFSVPERRGVVVKAQIHAGGRGKGGGVKIAKSVEEAAALAGKILGMTLVTHQTGPEGPGGAPFADRRNFAD